MCIFDIFTEMEEDSQFENDGIQSGEPLIGGVRLKQILDSLETGDLLPEADIVCNIVDKLERNINIAACLIQFANYTQVPVHNQLKFNF